MFGHNSWRGRVATEEAAASGLRLLLARLSGDASAREITQAAPCLYSVGSVHIHVGRVERCLTSRLHTRRALALANVQRRDMKEWDWELWLAGARSKRQL